MDIKKFAVKVRHRIQELRLSQAEVAEHMGWTASQVSDMIRKNRPPKPEILLDLADVLNSTVDELINDRIEPSGKTGSLKRISDDEEKILHYARVLGMDIAERRLIGAPETIDERKWDRNWGGDLVPQGEVMGEEPKKSKPGPA